MKQRAQITFEQRETVILKQSESHLLEVCPYCEAEMLFVTPEILAAMTGASEREIFRLIEAGAIPFVERNRTYACSECYRKSIEQSSLIPEVAAVKKLEEFQREDRDESEDDDAGNTEWIKTSAGS